jgi:hypothetical protein
MSSVRSKLFQAAVMMLWLVVVGCSGDQNGSGPTGKEWNADDAVREYQMIQAELKMSELGKPYLVLNFDKKQVRLKLKGAVVWEFPINFEAADASQIASFADHFHKGDRLVRPITTTHLYAYKEQTPDSILAIISEVTNFDAALLQRELPARFELHWGDEVIMDIRTDVEGKPVDKFKNTIVEVRNLLQSPLGSAKIMIKMDPVHALTLYRMAQPGLATMVQPPKG